MPATILTRDGLLGVRADRWSGSQSPSSDIGTYGAPTGAFAIQGLAQWSHLPTVAVGAAAMLSGNGAVTVQHISPEPSDGGAITSNGAYGGIVGLVASGTLTVPTMMPTSSEAGTPFHDLQPIGIDPGSAIGSGSVSSGTAELGPEGVVAPQAAASSTSAGQSHDAVVAAVQQSAAQLEQALAALTSHLHDIPAASLGGIAEVQSQASALVGQMTGMVSDQVATVIDLGLGSVSQANDLAQTVVDDALEAGGRAVEEAADTVSSIANNAVEGLSGAGTAVVEDAVALIPAIAAATDDVMEALGGDMLSAVAGITTQALGIVPDTGLLEEVGGIDPVGGLSTLTGMVTAADIFALPDNGDHIFETSPADAALGMVDSLADIAPADALLGIDHHDDGLVGSVASLDDHLPLSGLGL